MIYSPIDSMTRELLAELDFYGLDVELELEDVLGEIEVTLIKRAKVQAHRNNLVSVIYKELEEKIIGPIKESRYVELLNDTHKLKYEALRDESDKAIQTLEDRIKTLEKENMELSEAYDKVCDGEDW